MPDLNPSVVPDHRVTTVDVDFLKRFDRPGPRYTSYPTAPMFSPEYTAHQFELDLIHNNDEQTAPLSLYVHIPFCDSLCYFCGCTTVVTSNRNHIASYIDDLKKEIARASVFTNRRRHITQMHWGGGTPSYLTPEEIARLSEFLRSRFNFGEQAEFSVELDPRGLTREHMQAFRDSGVNRVSLGVQDFDERVQKAVNRVQPEALTVQTVEWARALGVGSVNVDLIYGLPLQTPASFQKTLDRIVELSPDRVAVFNFAYVPRLKPHQKLIHPEDLPPADTKLELLKAAIETLTGAGYRFIGMDHFAKAEDELFTAQQNKTLHRNFQGYSTKAGADLLGFGMSAISHFGGIYAQNAKTVAEYRGLLEQKIFPTQLGYRMNPDDRIREYVIMRIMCDLEVDKREVEERFDIRFDRYFRHALEQLVEFRDLGLVVETPGRIVVEGPGRLVLRNISMCFDAYLGKIAKERAMFSRTV